MSRTRLLSSRRWEIDDRIVLAGFVVLLAGFNVVRRLVVPGEWHLVANMGMIALVVVVAVVAAMSAAELGLERERLGSGAVLGGAITIVIGAAVAVAAALGWATLSDDWSSMGDGELWWHVLIEIPVATVVVEELAFRGVLLALLLRVVPVRRALVVSSVLFGVWHVAPATTAAGADATVARTLVTVSVTVLATAIAGAVLTALRQRSGSLLAPSLVHWGTNGLSLAILWSFAR